MRTIEEIKAEIKEAINAGKTALAGAIALELFNSIRHDIPLDRLQEICEAERDGRCVVLPCRNDEIVHAIEVALKIKLYDWQKAYMFGASNYLMSGRRTGQTTAYMLKLLLSEGQPIHLYKPQILHEVCDEPYHGSHYEEWFKCDLRNMYYDLSNPGLKLKLRKIYFTKGEADREAAEQALKGDAE